MNERRQSAHPVDIGQATSVDEGEIRSLLRSCDLPEEDVHHHLPHFIVASREGRIVGTVGLEVVGSSALLRSLAVAAPSRYAGLATTLVEAIVDRARRLGVRELWLLTTTAEGFFAKRGFQTVPRSETPPEIRSTREFRALCPDSAVLMSHRIDSGRSRPDGGRRTIQTPQPNVIAGQENGG